MQVHQIYRQQSLAITVEQAWRFFSSPHYLNQITPDFFNVEIKSAVPDSIYSGLMISYQMKAVAGFPMAWLSEISHCQYPNYFVYQQREGPFKFWSHEVRISETATGINVEDIVFYTMPFGWLGELMHGLLIGKKLQAIFDTRRDYLQQKWGVKANE